MKFCQDHWDELREKIIENGLGHLISKSGEEAMAKLRPDRNFIFPDPLLDAHNRLIGRAMEAFGLWIMSPDDAGNERCPMCELNKTASVNMVPPVPYKTFSEFWYAGLLKFMVKEYTDKGFIKREN